MQDLTKEQVIEFIKRKKIAVALVSTTVFIVIVGLWIYGSSRNPTRVEDETANNTNNQTTNATPSKKPFNPLGLFENSEKNDDSSKKTIATSLENIHSGDPSAPIPASLKKVQNGQVTSQPLTSGSIIQTTQGSINPNGNIQTGVDSSTQVDNIRIVFQNPDGTTFTYIPPGTPPDEVRWGRYTNDKFKYAINFPINWQFVYSLDENGNEGVALYPPNVDPNSSSSPFIGYGTTDNFSLPTVLDTTGALATPLIVDGYQGTLYTNGPVGQSYIASVLKYSNKFFGLGASKSDATFAYVYYYMINSLTFNIE